MKTPHVPSLSPRLPHVRDRFGRVLKQVWTQENSELVHLEYTYDRLGNRTSKRDVLAEQAGADLDEIYTYDQQNQLIDLDRVGNHEHFHYDTTGNWLAYQRNGTLQTRTHNAANEIVSLDGSDTSLRTDAAGNMTRIPNPKAGIVRADYSSVFCVTRRFAAPRRVEPESLNLTYDAWNRLVRVSTPDGSEVISCSYDGLNRRVRKTTASETREYYYNKNWQCLEEYLYGTLQNSYLWGLRYLDDLICFTPDYTIALTDANFNVVAVANQSGLIERYTYTAFGQRTILTPSYAPRSESMYPALTRTFTSQILDHETGLTLYRNRYYAPTLGRFITRDPIGHKGLDINLYRYVKNLVLIRIDALGLFLSSGATNWCEKMRFVLAFPLSWPCTYFHVKEFNQEADRLTESIYGNNHSQWTGETDAFRHCYWSCIMTVSASREFSRTIANIHEECHPDESIGSHNMDYYNNIQGRSLGIESKTWKDCENKCHKALVSGTLRTSYRTDEQEDPLLQTLNEIL